ncbi:MAG: CPBP family intramembrane metalloprotease [Prevotellaceae bacterium]|jgi:membrane protease YdiL (CAAX protease family)|nr:CPBP family intramembrane metalloprotease [Prevotellaceae bacterium]
MNNQQAILSFKFQIKHAWMVVGLFFAVTLAVTIPVFIADLIISKLSINSQPLESWITVLSNIVTYAFLFFLINQIFGKSTISKPLFGDKRIDWTVYILLLLATLSIAIILEPLNTLIVKLLPMPDWVEEIFSSAFTPSIATFIMVAIIAPLCEEILLRGVILRGLLNSSSPRKAIIWSAFLFALIHLNPWQGVFAFLIGLFLGWVYWKTRSIWTCIFIHFINNSLSFVGLVIAESKGLGVDATLEDITGEYFVSLFFVAAVLLIVSLGLLHKRYRLKKGIVP